MENPSEPPSTSSSPRAPRVRRSLQGAVITTIVALGLIGAAWATGLIPPRSSGEPVLAVKELAGVQVNFVGPAASLFAWNGGCQPCHQNWIAGHLPEFSVSFNVALNLTGDLCNPHQHTFLISNVTSPNTGAFTVTWATAQAGPNDTGMPVLLPYCYPGGSESDSALVTAGGPVLDAGPSEQTLVVNVTVSQWE